MMPENKVPDKLVIMIAVFISLALILNTLSINALTGKVTELEKELSRTERTYPLQSPCDGDFICDEGEDCENCPFDCGLCGCGDVTCSGIEDCLNCPNDCGGCVWCGDGTCTGWETERTCPEDCIPPPAGGGGTDEDEDSDVPDQDAQQGMPVGKV